jgi:hypothetical protein
MDVHEQLSFFLNRFVYTIQEGLGINCADLNAPQSLDDRAPSMTHSEVKVIFCTFTN